MLWIILNFILISNFVFTANADCPSALKLVTIDRSNFTGKNWYFVLTNQALAKGTTICEEILYQNVNYNVNALYVSVARREIGPQGSSTIATMNNIYIADTTNGTVINFNDGSGNLNIAAVNYDDYYISYSCNNANGNVVLDVYSTNSSSDALNSLTNELKTALQNVSLESYANFNVVPRLGCKNEPSISLNGGSVSISQ